LIIYQQSSWCSFSDMGIDEDQISLRPGWGRKGPVKRGCLSSFPAAGLQSSNPRPSAPFNSSHRPSSVSGQSSHRPFAPLMQSCSTQASSRVSVASSSTQPPSRDSEQVRIAGPSSDSKPVTAGTSSQAREPVTRGSSIAGVALQDQVTCYSFFVRYS